METNEALLALTLRRTPRKPERLHTTLAKRITASWIGELEKPHIFNFGINALRIFTLSVKQFLPKGNNLLRCKELGSCVRKLCPSKNQFKPIVFKRP